MRSSDFRDLCKASLATGAELRDAMIGRLISPELSKFLRRRVMAKREAICALLKPEIKFRVDAMQNGWRCSVLDRRRGNRGK
jgi:hypothetical protein